MTKANTAKRLDNAMVESGMVHSRSQASSFIKLGKVLVNDQAIKKAGYMVKPQDKIVLTAPAQYVSRAGLKLESVAKDLDLSFTDKVVLDIGSSTGGFTDYALKNGAAKVFAVDVGTNQLHPSLHAHEKIVLNEKTDIRHFLFNKNDPLPDIILIDVSFISLREILPHVKDNLTGPNTIIVAMVKPQFEQVVDSFGVHGTNRAANRGVIKNEKVRRQILRNFEEWAKNYFYITDKRDSSVKGEKGNTERFYKLKTL